MKPLKLFVNGLIFVFLIQVNSSAQSWKESSGNDWDYDLSNIRIFTIIDDGFNYEEAIEISNYWKNWGAEIEIAGTKTVQSGTMRNPAGNEPI